MEVLFCLFFFNTYLKKKINFVLVPLIYILLNNAQNISLWTQFFIWLYWLDLILSILEILLILSILSILFISLILITFYIFKISQNINTINKNISFIIKTRQRNFANIRSNSMQFTLKSLHFISNIFLWKKQQILYVLYF